jgi:hypothetical protein
MFEQSETLSFGLKLLSFVPFLSTWFIFTLIYMIVPNKKVSLSSFRPKESVSDCSNMALTYELAAMLVPIKSGPSVKMSQ